jgi:RimJ/RimL family protein N-acetyltransferase
MIFPRDDVVARGRKVVLRRKRLGDAEGEYRWRTDPEMARYDGTPPVRVSFADYFRRWSFDLRFTDMGHRSFAIEDEMGNHIGNIMYYNVDKTQRDAELGISIGQRRYWGQGYGSDALVAMANYIFNQTDLQRLYLHTLDWNLRAQRCFHKAGFQVRGTSWRNGETFIVMEAWRERLLGG